MGISFPFLFLALTSISIHQAQSSGFTTEYVGCFNDYPLVLVNHRVMTFAENMGSNATIERCTTICYNSEKKYAGLQHSEECFCSNGGYDRYGEDPDGCKDECKGNKTQICGDGYRNSVYQIIPISNMSTNSTYPTTTTTTDTTTTIHITTSTNKKPATTTTQLIIPTNRSGGNQTDSAPLENLKQTTEPDFATKNLGTYIGAGVGAVAGCAALIIIVLIMVKRGTQLKNRRAADNPQHEEIYSLAEPYADNGDNMEAATPHVVNGEEYAVINKKSPNSHPVVRAPALLHSEPAQGAEETYQNVHSEEGGATAVCYSTARELGNWGYVTGSGSYVTVPSYIASSRDEATTDTVVVENDLYGT